jgi:hypothetical protein
VTVPKPLQTCVFEGSFHPHSYPAESHLYVRDHSAAVATASTARSSAAPALTLTLTNGTEQDRNQTFFLVKSLDHVDVSPCIQAALYVGQLFLVIVANSVDGNMWYARPTSWGGNCACILERAEMSGVAHKYPLWKQNSTSHAQLFWADNAQLVHLRCCPCSVARHQ